MSKFLTPEFLKFFTRFIIIILISIVSILIVGNLNDKQKEARTYYIETPDRVLE